MNNIRPFITHYFFRISIRSQRILFFSSSKRNTPEDSNDAANTKKELQKIKSPETNSDKNENKDIKNKLEALEQNVNTFKSIGPNEKETINREISKPKTYVRQSAKPKENIQVKDNVETLNVLARGLDKRLVEAARRVADRMPKHLTRQTEKQLLDSIQKQKKETSEAAKKFAAQKEDITKSISYKILRAKTETKKSLNIDDVKTGTTSTVVKIKLPREFLNFNNIQGTKKTNLLFGECLSIFDPKGIYMTDMMSRNTFWEKLSQRELELFFEGPAENFFEEQIKLTEEGKLWHYPINNEQGLEHEECVPFYEHVLLDNLLNEFPKEGPVRQFMELVLMGLSQNPYISVERKKETIKYYQDFFKERNLIEIAEMNE